MSRATRKACTFQRYSLKRIVDTTCGLSLTANWQGSRQRAAAGPFIGQSEFRALLPSVRWECRHVVSISVPECPGGAPEAVPELRGGAVPRLRLGLAKGLGRERQRDLARNVAGKGKGRQGKSKQIAAGRAHYPARCSLHYPAHHTAVSRSRRLSSRQALQATIVPSSWGCLT